MPTLPGSYKHKRPMLRIGWGMILGQDEALRTSQNYTKSVFRNGRINLVGPGEDAALQVEDFAETRLAQEIHGLRRTLSAAAMRHDFSRGIEFVNAPRQLPEREKVPFEIADLVFVGLAHIENE
jgi:hypothetical protein